VVAVSSSKVMESSVISAPLLKDSPSMMSGLGLMGQPKTY
jgi:hypothetical protein